MIRTNNDIATPREEIASRLAYFRKIHDFSQVEFAKKLSLSPRSYQNYELGIREVPVATIANLIKEFEINSHWLISGEGGPHYVHPAKAARMALDDIISAIGELQIEPDLSSLQEVQEIIIKQFDNARPLNPDEVQNLVRLAARSKN